MPKRTSKTQRNTLLQYFTPPREKPSTPNLNKQKENTQPEKGDDTTRSKRKRSSADVVSSDSDSERTESPGPSTSRGKKVKTTLNLFDDMSDDSDCERIITSTKRKNLSDNGDDADSSNKLINDYAYDSPSSSADGFEERKVYIEPKKVVNMSSEQTWEHNKMEFLQPQHIRDGNKRRPNDPEYDGRTLYVPKTFLSEQTPAMHQWWIMKRSHYDTVLFFKVGKFYELYHMDAVIGVKHLSLSYMKGSFAHSGFPEIAFERMADSLVNQGFKIARIEQTETPEMMNQRYKSTKRPTKYDKVVKREICQVLTTGTRIYGVQIKEPKMQLSSYMIAIAERRVQHGTRFGVCFVDTSLAMFHLGEFNDDTYYSNLLALMATHPPELILMERGCMRSETLTLLNNTFSNVRKEILVSKSQFYDAQQTINLLIERCYFKDKEDNFYWPKELENLIENGNTKPEYELALKSLGACVWYLKESVIDIQLLSRQKFCMYDPIIKNKSGKHKFLILDSKTLDHLKVLGDHRSLYCKIDFCVTPFGKRLLQEWISQPLCSQKSIQHRQEAVKELMNNDQLRLYLLSMMSKLPDLERIFSKIHIFGNRHLAKEHPDSRAVFYESTTYSANKINDLIMFLQGFESTLDLSENFNECKSKLLLKLTRYTPNGRLCDLTSILEHFKNKFDFTEAKEKSKIIPQEGIDRSYDDIIDQIINLESNCEQYRREQDKFFGCKVLYHGTGKNRYQLEIPEYKCYMVTKEYKLETRRNGSQPVRRYSTPTSRKLLADMIRAESLRDKILQNLNRFIFEQFGEREAEWNMVIKTISKLDVLCSFAEYAKKCTYPVCFPRVLSFNDESFIEIENGVHPCTELEDFVPNNIYLGTEGNPKIMILTGPNMGGKSTIMRQTALITIMAQMGCPVPAESCKLTMVDRIFTRIGAQDDAFQGVSTFMVELTEAAAILQHATKHSFVLVDELGRGTSTHDGNAIASAYLSTLMNHKCRVIFSTHYHSLVESFSTLNRIQLAHMACLSNQDKSNDRNMSLTLLYQLQSGKCPQSYGFNAAHVAGLPNNTIRNAMDIARYFKTIALNRKKFKAIVNSTTDDICSILMDLTKLDV